MATRTDITTRAANATIKGYFYQFDSSILEILKLTNDSHSVSIEGIEDIDINTVDEKIAIQCKYYEGTEYNHSVIAEAIRLMLNHFSEYKKGLKTKIKYILRGHYKSGQHKLTMLVDTTFLKKNFLTYTNKKKKYEHHIDLSLSDADLNDFLALLEIDINAKSFQEQFNELVGLLKIQFNCEYFSAEHFYYNNSLRQIKNLSIQSNLSDRTITKKEFISLIDTKKVLFTEWFIALKSKKEYIKIITQNLKSVRALEASRAKIILVGKEIIEADNTELPIETFIQNLIAKYYKINSVFRDAKPLTLVLDSNDNKLKEIKSQLINSNTIFNDGFEHINFSYTIFNAKPIITKSNNGTKITNSSYLIKLISKNTFDAHFANIEAPTVFISFSKNDVSNQFTTGQFFDFKYCETLPEVFQVLTK